MTILTCPRCKDTFQPKVIEGEIQLWCDDCFTEYVFTAAEPERTWLRRFLRAIRVAS